MCTGSSYLTRLLEKSDKKFRRGKMRKNVLDQGALGFKCDYTWAEGDHTGAKGDSPLSARCGRP